jgi:hypothetical protein
MWVDDRIEGFPCRPIGRAEKAYGLRRLADGG